MSEFIQLQLLSLTLMILYFDVLSLHVKINRKPFNCKLCTGFWIGITVSIFAAFTALEDSTVILLALCSLPIAKLYNDYL